MGTSVEVDMEKLVDHFQHDFRRALQQALAEVAPSVKVDPNTLFIAFRHGVRRCFRNSEELPSKVIK